MPPITKAQQADLCKSHGPNIYCWDCPVPERPPKLWFRLMRQRSAMRRKEDTYPADSF